MHASTSSVAGEARTRGRAAAAFFNQLSEACLSPQQRTLVTARPEVVLAHLELLGAALEGGFRGEAVGVGALPGIKAYFCLSQCEKNRIGAGWKGLMWCFVEHP